MKSLRSIHIADRDRLLSDSADESGYALSRDGSDQSDAEQPVVAPTINGDTEIAKKLFVSHFLSTWNSRAFEFGATLFLATIFPDTLQPLSVYALVRSASAIICAPSIGRAIDSRGRLGIVRFSIVAGRGAVILSALGFWALYSLPDIVASARWGIFAALVIFSCIEKVAAIINLISVERDWVVVIARNDEAVLQKLNSQLRRIDLSCKLLGPFVIALIDGVSVEAAIWITLGMNIISVPVEYIFIAKVYKMVPELQGSVNTVTLELDEHASSFTVHETSRQAPDSESNSSSLAKVRDTIVQYTTTIRTGFRLYTKHEAFLPSFSLSLLYLTVLSLSGQQITYFLASGFTPFTIAIVRTLSVLFELVATWLAPLLMSRIGPIRSGMWFLSLQMLSLGATAAFFFSNERTAFFAACVLATGTIISRIGLWGYDLSAQVIIQSEVDTKDRGAFSSTEAGLQNFFELLSYTLTIALPRPEQFGWPVLLSVGAVYSAGALHGVFLRRRRGHLLHVNCLEPKVDSP